MRSFIVTNTRRREGKNQGIMQRYIEIDLGTVKTTQGPSAPLREGWVRIRVAACGICGTDLHLLQGMRLPTGASYPVRPGHEVSGWVTETADPSGADLIGHLVVLHPLNTCGECPACMSGQEQRCRGARILGIHEAGGLSDKVDWPACRVVSAHGLLPEQAAILADAGATAYHSLRAADLSPGASLCVLGAGGVGTQVALIARALDPTVRIAAVVGSPTSADRIAPLVDRVEVGVSGVGKRLRVAGWRFDAVIDFSNQADAPLEGLRMLNGGGLLILGSVSDDPVSIGPGVLVQSRELTVKGVYTSTIDDLRAVVNLAQRGLIDLQGSVTHRFPLDQAARAMEVMAERPPGMVRVVVIP